jgi:DNA repair protein RadC
MTYKKHDRKVYKYYIINPFSRLILEGFEFKEDAEERRKDISRQGLTVYTRAYLKRMKVDPSINKNWGSDKPLGKVKNYPVQKEVVLYGDFRKDIQIPEIKVRYNKGKVFDKINNSNSTAEFLRRVYGRSIDLQEHFVLLLFDNSLNVMGYYKHTVGTPVSTLADIPMLLGIALKAMARSIIVSHNHPSGNPKPSQADIDLTKQINKAAKTVNISFLDHIIITKNNGYTSLADQGLMSLSGLGNVKPNKLENELRQEVFQQLKKAAENPKLTPEISALIKDKSGYEWMERRIIQMMISDSITASACIPQIESEL